MLLNLLWFLCSFLCVYIIVVLLFFYYGHCVVCPFVLLLWPLCCLSFCSFSYGYWIVCPFCSFSDGYWIVCPFLLFLMAIDLSVLLIFFSYGYWIVCSSLNDELVLLIGIFQLFSTVRRRIFMVIIYCRDLRSSTLNMQLYDLQNYHNVKCHWRGNCILKQKIHRNHIVVESTQSHGIIPLLKVTFFINWESKKGSNTLKFKLMYCERPCNYCPKQLTFW